MAKLDNVELVGFKVEGSNRVRYNSAGHLAKQFHDHYGRDLIIDEDDLRRMVENYDPSFYEASGNIDHRKGGPAYGHVKALRYEQDVDADGKTMGVHVFGDIDDIPEDFFQELKEKRYTNRSSEIEPVVYRDLEGRGPYLKAFAWLGTLIPAARGLQPISLAGHDERGEYYSIPKEKEVEKGVKQLLKFSKDALTAFGKSVGDLFTVKVEPDADGDGVALALAEPLAPPPPEEPKPDPKIEACLAERDSEIAALKAENKAASVRLAELEQTERQRTVETVCTTLLAEGRMIPAELPAVRDHLLYLKCTGETIKLADGKEVHPFDQYVATLKARPAVYATLLSEFSPPPKDEVEATLSSAEAEAAAAVGVSADEMLAYKSGGSKTQPKGGDAE